MKLLVLVFWERRKNNDRTQPQTKIQQKYRKKNCSRIYKKTKYIKLTRITSERER